MTTSATLTGGLDSYVHAMRLDGYSQRAIDKMLRLLRNHAPRPCANTDTNTNPSELDENGRMLDLTAKRPPSWAEAIIRRGLAARGISETEWPRAWAWFRGWNIDSRGNDRIAARALISWLRTCKLQPEQKRTPQPEAPTAGATLDHELTRIMARASFPQRSTQETQLVAKIGRAVCFGVQF